MCTSCQDTLTLQKGTGKCLLDCDSDGVRLRQVAIDGECVPCTGNCETCQGSPDYCVSCKEGFFFYANECRTTCPFVDKYQYKPNDYGQCVIKDFRCPFGYDVVPEGNACVLKAVICEEPKTLNYDKTKCIPGSEEYILFPILFFSILLVIIVVFSKCKAKETKFVSSMIAFLVLAEKVALISLLWNAISFGIKPVVYLVVIGFVFEVGIDLFFLLVFTQQIK